MSSLLFGGGRWYSHHPRSRPCCGQAIKACIPGYSVWTTSCPLSLNHLSTFLWGNIPKQQEYTLARIPIGSRGIRISWGRMCQVNTFQVTLTPSYLGGATSPCQEFLTNFVARASTFVAVKIILHETAQSIWFPKGLFHVNLKYLK